MTSTTRRVLMISPHFPPDSTAATHRVRLLAPHLPAHGWRPTVLTVDPRDYEGRLDPALASSVPADIDVVRCRAWPVARVRPFGFGDLGIRAFGGLQRAATSLMTREPFDAVFITIYPTYPALLGPRLKARFGVPFVLDYQDPWVGEWGRSVGPNGRADVKSRASRALASRLEPVALRAADAVTAVSRATFELALARNPAACPVTTAELPIGWDVRDFDRVRARGNRGPRRAPGDPFRISYVGTLLPAGHETLRALFAAVDRLRASGPDVAGRLRMRFVGTSNQRSPQVPHVVREIAREFGLDDAVQEEPSRVDYFDALDALVDADAVLLLGSREAHYTPSKLFPALLSERPLLAIYHQDSTAIDLLRQAGGEPGVRVVTYGDDGPADRHIDAMAGHLRHLIQQPCGARAFDPRAFESSSARALAGRLAEVFDTVAARSQTWTRSA
jgi:glycosyl transferase family 4